MRATSFSFARIKHTVGLLNNRESSSVKISELILVHQADKGTPQLFKASFSSQSRTINIHRTRTDFKDSLTPYMSYELKNALISGYRIRAHTDDQHQPNEEIKISYSALMVRYLSQDAKGLVSAPLRVGFDLEKHTLV